MKRLFNFELMVRVGVHIVSKFICAHVQKQGHTFEQAHSIFDVLFFAPGAKTRTTERRTTAGIAFRDMRSSVTKAYLTNCRALARQMEERSLDENKDPNATETGDPASQKWQWVLWTQDNFVRDTDIARVVENFHRCQAEVMSLGGNGDSAVARPHRSKRRKDNGRGSRTTDEEI